MKGYLLWVTVGLAALAPVGDAQEADWVDLIGGTDLGAWRQPSGKWETVGDVTSGPDSPRRLAATPGTGTIYNGKEGRTGDLLSKQEFGDVELHVEFMVPRQSNSGIYLMGRYEVQVLDSYGVEASAYPGNQCGGIYPRWLDNRNVGGHAPRVKASKPAGQWQSFDLVFRAPRFDAGGHKIAHARFEKVFHNGVLIHEDAMVTGPTRAARFANEADETLKGPIQLQGDHGPVAYRNLRVRPLPPENGPHPFPKTLHAMDTYTKQRFPNSDFTRDQQLDMIRAAGYAGVGWDKLSTDATRQLVQAAEARGLALAALYYQGNLTREGLSWDPSLLDTIKAVKGSDAIVWLHIVSREFARSDPAGDAIAVPALRRLADVALANGIRVAIYPHKGDWTERVQDATRLARRVGHPALGVSFNLCHCLMVGDEEAIPELLGEAAPYLFIVTLNGADTGAGGTSWQRLIQTLDRGTYDLNPLLRTLHQLPFRGPIALQGYGLKGDVANNLQRSMKAWQRMVGEINGITTDAQ